ncbi:hypothetical protein CDO73_15540 [Saccharibacillus sp. O23]|uniref:hypothetical protein n=1 Tax=Saccharibacillus sp. O23 TaxID=2009338 RepID=UPI000B4E7010|nr:hypothetical protein [Saccharibacillus sp. O23]OWR29595.1 hypothetical protein CDO73_15540 [Saccharibacillus sp. O23]
MLKRFVWKENDVYSIRLKQNLYIPAQLLAKPYAAFYAIGSTAEDFGDLPPGTIDLNGRKPLGTCMVLKDFFKTCAAVKLTDRFVPSMDAEIPELFISPDPLQWGRRGELGDDELLYNLVRIDPARGDQGILGNPIVKRHVSRDDRALWDRYEWTGHNTGYELIRRLILSFEEGRWIDPAKEKARTGSDPYPLRTIEELRAAGVPSY